MGPIAAGVQIGPSLEHQNTSLVLESAGEAEFQESLFFGLHLILASLGIGGPKVQSKEQLSSTQPWA